MASIDTIFADPKGISLNVETLGECKIDSPIRNRDFIDADAS
jgi:hypothetical protein